MLDDYSLIDIITGRRILCQINASFLIRKETADLASKLIVDRRVHFLGSDCHNCDDRAPNLKGAADAAVKLNIESDLNNLYRNVERVLRMQKQ